MRFDVTLVTLGGLLAAAILATPAASATPSGDARPSILQGLSDCRKLTDAGERLACYDRATAGLEAAQAAGDVVVMDRAQVRDVRRQAFGFSLPSLNILGGDGKEEDVDTLALKIESVRRGGDGKWVFRLEGGQVWRQIDTAELMRQPKPGGTATIRRAALGSYKLSLGSAASIRVHRDD